MEIISGHPFEPILELTRGPVVESIHYGSVAVVALDGRLVAWHGNPATITYLRSSAKPFQALPFVEHGGQSAYGLIPREIALICASHSGTSDGDLAGHIRPNGRHHGTARPAVTIEVLRQLGVLSKRELEMLRGYGPTFRLHNWCAIEVGIARPCFRLRNDPG